MESVIGGIGRIQSLMELLSEDCAASSTEVVDMAWSRSRNPESTVYWKRIASLAKIILIARKNSPTCDPVLATRPS